MNFNYSRRERSYKLNFHCSEPESCNCNEKIIELFNNNSIYIMNTLRIVGLAHIKYEKIKDKIKHKVRVKKLYIWTSDMYNFYETLDLNVLKVLFYPDEIEDLYINNNQDIETGDVSYKKLKRLTINVYCETPDHILPLICVLPYIVKNCPNIEELELERDWNSKETLEFIIKTLIQLNKNLVITLNYINNYGFKEDDEKFIEENNLEKLDDKTIYYKLPNIDENIYVDISEITDRSGP